MNRAIRKRFSHDLVTDRVAKSRPPQFFHDNFGASVNAGVYGNKTHNMNDSYLLLYSLSPLSFIAFVILPAIFGRFF
jgi:hypothetical protein